MLSFLLAASLLLPAAAEPKRFSEDFVAYGRTPCIKEGAKLGPWTVLFTGFGCAKVEGAGSRSWLRVDTAASRRRKETHSVFVAGPGFKAPLDFQARVRTVRQLRRGRPNSWEVGWLVWDYQDNDHFYYFVPRINGWELGKRDPVYPSGQRSLVSGRKPSFPIRTWNAIRIVQDSGQGLGVYVRGVQIAYFHDTERPYLQGKIGFYDEDSRALISDIVVSGEPIAGSL